MGTRLSAALCGLSFQLLGCSYSAEQIPVGTPDDYDIRGAVTAVAVGANPIITLDESERYLGDDVTEKLLPIFIVVDNQSDEVKLIERAEALLSSSDGAALRPITAKRAVSTFLFSVSDASAVGGPVGNDLARTANSDMTTDWTRKELPASVMLRQGRKTAGVLFFSRPPGSGPLKLKVSLLGMKSNRTDEIELEIPRPARG